MRALLPENGKYYFDAADENLVRVYQTLGIKSLRVGANAVDDPRVAIPDTKEIDQLFNFARKAGCKVIYSFRLKKGDPANAARLAEYINKNYADTLDCFSIGNEPDFYFKTYAPYRDAWKPIYEAIIKAVPDAKFDGPVTSRKIYSLEFADEFSPGGHLKMVSTHNYPLANGREAEKDLPGARARFVSNDTHAVYQRIYDGIVKPLAEKKIPFRMDETNSCFRGGAKDCSDAYASSLWVLDYLNWWAAHHIQGLNFHTGDTVNGFPLMVANYAVFIHELDGKTFEMRPVSYGILAFSQAARGKTMNVKIDGAEDMDFTAYAFQTDDGGQSLFLLNKSYGPTATSATVSIKGATRKSHWRSIALEQATGDISARIGVTLGGATIDPTGAWTGQWTDVPSGTSDGALSVAVKPASAIILRLAAGQ
ncbi:MAG TPA: glycosyl hydrolase family 79 C-terminal domain-containing protein [Tepidisphaeraceae bacterium]|nr:glycosyl hydrolase family 79 C-terminal domain-containing protein [Tepidisphaeraceae bacterium]